MKDTKINLNKRDYILAAILILFSAFILFRNLDKNTPLYYDEALYSAKDLEFMEDGQNLFFPKGELQNFYTIKPPLKTWMKYPFYKAFGINTLTIRFLDASMGVLTVFLIFLFGLRLLDGWAGFSAGFIFVTFKGLLTDYWARVNGYDAGAVLGTVLFFYFFMFHREKKLGWLSCGLSLALITYFKHISAVLPFAVAFLYLFIEKGFKGLFNKRFFLMTGTWLLPVLAFYVPYAFYYKTFLRHFFGYEVFTVVTEGTGLHGRGDSFYYVKWLSRDTGFWFPIMIAALAASLFLVLKKKGKTLLPLLIWVLLPFVVLSIAATRINRYMFPSYPALALIAGCIISLVYKSLSGTKTGKKQKKKIILMPAIFSLLVLIVCVNAGVEAYKATEPFYRENYHRLADFYKSWNPGTLYLTEGNMKRYGWSEKVILHQMDGRYRVITENQTDEELVKNLGLDDAIALYNNRIFEMFYTTDHPRLSAEQYAIVDFAIDDSFYSRQKLFRKVILFRKDSPVTKCFEREKIKPLHLLNKDVFDSLDEKDFMAYISRLSFSAKSVDDSMVKYYSGKMKNAGYTRRELSNLFSCYSKWFTSKEIPDLIRKEIGAPDLPAFYHFSDYFSPEKPGSIYLRGLRFYNFTPASKCQVLRTRNRWIFLERTSDIEPVLKKISGDDVLLMRRADLVRWFESNKRGAMNSADKLDNSYSFFSLKKRSGYLRRQTRYFNIIGCVKTGGNLNNFLRSKGIEFTPFLPPEKLIDWKEPDDSEFVDQAIHVIFDCNPEPHFKILHINRLKNGIITRKGLVEMLLKQAEEIEY